jgi:hypothetical protein
VTGESIWTSSQSSQSVDYSDPQSADNDDVDKTSQASWAVIDGLDPDVVYEMRLAVWSDTGRDEGTVGGSTAPISTGPIQLVRVGTNMNSRRRQHEGPIGKLHLLYK